MRSSLTRTRDRHPRDRTRAAPSSRPPPRGRAPGPPVLYLHTPRVLLILQCGSRKTPEEPAEKLHCHRRNYVHGTRLQREAEAHNPPRFSAHGPYHGVRQGKWVRKVLGYLWPVPCSGSGRGRNPAASSAPPRGAPALMKRPPRPGRLERERDEGLPSREPAPATRTGFAALRS